MAKGQYIRIRYGNSTDFSDLIFTDGVYQDLYLDGAIGKSQYNVIEYGNRNENNVFTPNKKILEKYLYAEFIGGEWLVELMNIISLCDTIYLTNKNGETSKIIELKIEADTKEISKIQVKFVISRTVWEVSPSINTSLLGTPSATITLTPINNGSAVISDNNPYFTDPASNYLQDGYYIVLNTSENKYYAYRKIGITWNIIIPSFTDRFYDSLNNNPTYYVIKYNESPSIAVTPLPTIYSLADEGGGSYKITGECLDGYFIQLYGSADNITYTEIGTVKLAAVFNNDGITFNPGSYTYFKLGLIDYTFTVLLYTSEVEYPYP